MQWRRSVVKCGSQGQSGKVNRTFQITPALRHWFPNTQQSRFLTAWRRLEKLVLPSLNMPPPLEYGALSNDARLTSVCSPRHLWLGHHFQGQMVKDQLAGARSYCGGLPHSPRHMWLGHQFQGQKVKGQLVGGGTYCGGLPHIFMTHLSSLMNINDRFEWKTVTFQGSRHTLTLLHIFRGQYPLNRQDLRPWVHRMTFEQLHISQEREPILISYSVRPLTYGL